MGPLQPRCLAIFSKRSITERTWQAANVSGLMHYGETEGLKQRCVHQQVSIIVMLSTNATEVSSQMKIRGPHSSDILSTFVLTQTYTEAFTHRSFDTQTLLQTEAFTHKHFCTQTLLHTNTFTHKHLQTEAFTHRRFYAQRLLHTDAFTHRHFCTQALLHTDAFTHKRFYTQTFLHANSLRTL